MTVSLIAAMSENLVIGKDNALPGWKIPGDLKRFKALTVGKAVVMGRKTFESIGKPLPDRFNIVISSKMDGRRDDIWVVRSLSEALAQAECLNPGGEVMVIGGGMIYKQALPLADRLYLTVLHEKWEGDTFFPKLERNNWGFVNIEEHGTHTFVTIERWVSEPVKTDC
jgi:dihydrofolate reductase